jgi:threonine/homoserine/homoserine lactone efflux protein
MSAIHGLVFFIMASVILAVTPGPDTTLVFAQTMRHGLRGGVLTSLGVATGCLVHVTAASVGLSALLMASAYAFTVIKWIGAGYLAFIGLRMIDAAGRAAPPNARPPRLRRSSAFWVGFLTDVTNPKVALFFLAFLPQFIVAHAPNTMLGFALLGLIFTAIGFVWLMVVVLLASQTAAMLGKQGRLRAWLERALGAAFVALAAKLALAERP